MKTYQVDYTLTKYGSMEVTRETEEEAIEAVEEMIEGDGEIESIEAVELQ
jgi:hypothetical protein